MSVLIGTPSAIPALWELSNFPEVDMVRFAGVELRGVDDPRRVREVASVFVFPSLPPESSDVAEPLRQPPTRIYGFWILRGCVKMYTSAAVHKWTPPPATAPAPSA